MHYFVNSHAKLTVRLRWYLVAIQVWEDRQFVIAVSRFGKTST